MMLKHVPPWSVMLALLLLIVLLCPCTAAADAGTATFQQYDPNRTGEMIEQGLLEPIDPQQYEREMAALNESRNATLGCDDFPRCDPEAAGLLPLLPVAAIISMIALAGFVQKMKGQNQR